MKTIKQASSPRFTLEKLLLDIISVRYEIPLPYIVKRLSMLEQALAGHQKTTTPPTNPEKPSSTQKTIPTENTEQKASLPAQPIKRPTPISAQNVEQEKQRQEHLMQFAAVELEGTLQKKKR